jgi:hypothetical protein
MAGWTGDLSNVAFVIQGRYEALDDPVGKSDGNQTQPPSSPQATSYEATLTSPGMPFFATSGLDPSQSARRNLPVAICPSQSD